MPSKAIFASRARAYWRANGGQGELDESDIQDISQSLSLPKDMVEMLSRSKREDLSELTDTEEELLSDIPFHNSSQLEEDLEEETTPTPSSPLALKTVRQRDREPKGLGNNHSSEASSSVTVGRARVGVMSGKRRSMRQMGKGKKKQRLV